MVANLVSVVIPVYNGRQYVRQAIDSVLQQTHAPVEIIAVDDGSTDDSAEILAGYGQQITLIRQANGGVAAARNAGIAHARGEFIAFLDQDDWWLPEKLSLQVAAMRSDERIGLVHTGVGYFDDASSQLVAPPNPAASPMEMVGSCYGRLLLGNPICNSSVVVRRTILDSVGPCDLQISGNTVQDYDLWLRVAQVSHIGCVGDDLTRFRMHADQGHQDRRAMLSEELKVLMQRQSEREWLLSLKTRQRITKLYDELAVAHFDAGEFRLARDYFFHALRLGWTRRQLFRFLASSLPADGVNLFRRWKQSIYTTNLWAYRSRKAASRIST